MLSLAWAIGLKMQFLFFGVVVRAGNVWDLQENKIFIFDREGW